MIWLAEIWHFLFGWPGVDIIVGAIAIAVAVLEPPLIAAIIPDLRKWMIAVAVVAFTFLSISGKFYNDGIAVKQAEWDRALAAETIAGNAARSSAVATVGPVSADRGLLRANPWNRGAGGIKPPGRTKSPVRWLARHRI